MADARAISAVRAVTGTADLRRRHAGDEASQGARGCPRDSEQRSFWTEQFKLGKRIEPALPADIRDSAPIASDLAVIIDSWTFSGDDAEKTIETACAGFSGLEGCSAHGTMRSTSPSSGANETPQFVVYNAPSGPSTSPFGRLANPVSTFIRLPVLRSNLTRLAVSVDH